MMHSTRHPLHQALSADAMLAAHSKRIDLIRQYANEADAKDFDSKWLGVLRACGEWHSSIPMRPDMHSEPGGAFRATVETAYYAMRLSGGQKFAADRPSERRRELEPQYLYALFLAACCSWLDEPFRHFSFHRIRDGQEWQPAAHGSFGAWLDGDEYKVTRREVAFAPERMRTALLARDVLGMERVARFDNVVLTDLFGAINPEAMPSGLETLLHKVVRQATEAVNLYERKSRQASFAPDQAPIPTAEQMVAAADAQQAEKPAPKKASPPSLNATTPTASEAAEVAALFQPPADAPASASAQGPSAVPAQSNRPAPLQMTSLEVKRTGKVETNLNEPLEAAIAKAPNLMKEFFRALAQDIAGGKVEVTRLENRVVLAKRTIGSYGIASDTLIDNLRKMEWLYRSQGSEIVLVEAISRLLAPM